MDITEPTKITSIKGFDANLQCRGHQFVVGQTYTHTGKVEACNGGFHAVPEDVHPLAVFGYYAPAGSRFCIVEQSGATDREDDKVASEIMTVVREICLAELAEIAVKWVMDRATHEGPVAVKYQGAATATGDQGAATATGDHGAATATGDQGAATATGDHGAATATDNHGAATATGDQGAATSSGYQGTATASGDRGAATASGYQGAATASSYRGAATSSGYRGAATSSGYQGAATASGYQGAATASSYRGAATASGYQGTATASGDQGTATASGDQGANAMATGKGGMVCGVDGAGLYAVERGTWDGPIVSNACGIVGQDGIKPMVWYECVGGKLVEVAA